MNVIGLIVNNFLPHIFIQNVMSKSFSDRLPSGDVLYDRLLHQIITLNPIPLDRTKSPPFIQMCITVWIKTTKLLFHRNFKKR